ncbi:hypothetical protein A2419_01720 [Candidatus Adlerbacteria bacterium RIFOXYC1_FULL_48_26]|uniref:Uncharacterized protein n=1 Tax=Candidatus Adlerbacteria bacterium RIFOXYC1_FULL_48_26 TaxID=1797247 RepID=A0A1F4Y587_9BACT|nr:MAG: hypothetical protein A2419_01720 [Candidatus Adlerbacteria bacterium RIFOXYC1_FULL_48_26]OGC94178.1 MAG: hypothetical protein A2389_02090 [Candidatus Adlerbacteria bacterium RIFOXYB1_FULL_48_10]OGC95738.1 MAG: hypothetical protein A2590_02555 [Candidatus Adlerbacteria bacterium RIFOXYD1_FULL_48_8]
MTKHMTSKNVAIGAAIVVILLAGYFFFYPKTAATPPGAQGKINVDTVCRGALAYMTFTDAASAEVFIAECKEGKHPEVIERYKAEMNLGDGAAI